MTLRRLGKFEVLRLLGKGGQSTVFLAHDPQLQREVAIKLLRIGRGRARSAVMDEARTAGGLHHPNIVTVYEAGEEAESPYIVFEYVDGPSLAQAIRERGAIEASRAAELMIGVLSAIAHAHAAGVVHRDLKPSNILLDRDGRARVMDFGIALRVGGAGAHDALVGTPAYMAPEYIDAGTVGPSNDVFAAGLCLYEMVFGRRAIDAATDFEALHKIANEPLVFPPDAFERADERLIDLIAKATARDPALRYGSALQMQQALRAYLNPQEAGASAQGGGTVAASGTLEFLLRRMQHRSDFPSMSAAMTAVNRLAQSEQGDANRLSALILKDFALTNKLLRVANSAHYNSGRGGSVSTVSRAIVVLGFDAVRNLALSLILFERLQDKSHAEALKEEFLRASVTGTLARELGAELGGCSAEEYFVCAVFRNLGRLLAHYYLREEALAVERVVAREGVGEDLASRRVLGIGYRDLGIGVARSWGFPDSILQSMVSAPVPRKPPASTAERLRLVSTVSDELRGLIEQAPVEQRPEKLAQLVKSYGAALPVEDRALRGVVERALDASRELATALRFNPQRSFLAGRLSAPGGEKPAAADMPVGEASLGSAAAIDDPSAIAPNRTDAQAVLAAGIQDLSQALVEDLPQADLLRIVAETSYRAFGFRRVLLCLREEREPVLVARYALGAEAELPWDRFRVRLQGGDLFALTIARGADLLIRDAEQAKIRERLPDWYREGFYARSFLLMPMRRGDLPVGLLYADQDVVAGIQIAEPELALLRTLRNQALLAFRPAR